jgi:hypothetical protein
MDTNKEKKDRNHFEIFLFILLVILILYLISYFFYPTGFSITGNVISANLQEQIANISFVIELKDAEHFGNDYLNNIYNEVKEFDEKWSGQIYDKNHVRIIFEQDISSKNAIIIYPKIISGNPKIEVYEKDGEELIAEFTPLISNKYNKIFLTNLKNSQNTFDLKVIDGSLEIDYIASL